ncbi:MAG: GNAT family N-acetyltransferase [Microthrixaceae bacterium]
MAEAGRPWGVEGRQESANEALEEVKAALRRGAAGPFSDVFPGKLGAAVVQMLLSHCCGEALESYVSIRSSCEERLHWIESTSAHAESPRPLGSASRVRLRPVIDTDVPSLYDASLRPDLSFRWRFKGSTPSPEGFYQSLYAGTYSQFIVEGTVDRERYGLVAAYDNRPDLGVVSIGFQRVSPRVTAGETFEGMFHFIELLFAASPLRKIYAEVPGYNEALLGLGSVGPFVEEGRLIQHDYHGEQWWDHHYFAVWRSAWDAFASPLREALVPQVVHQ